MKLLENLLCIGLSHVLKMFVPLLFWLISFLCIKVWGACENASSIFEYIDCALLKHGLNTFLI